MEPHVERTMEDIESKMKKTDEKLDTLAVQVGNIEQEIFADNGQEIEVHNLLRSVSEVKSNYQNLRKEILEVQDLQKQLSSTLNIQLKMMQSHFHTLKERISIAEAAKYNQNTKSHDQLLNDKYGYKVRNDATL